MLIGIYLRELWRHKVGLALSTLLATVATVQVVWGIGLMPPRIGGDSLQMASASAQVVVDTPRSSAVDPQVDAFTLQSLTNRALILGNVMASPPVVRYIARHAAIPPEKIRVEPPLTPEQPRAVVDSAHAAHVSDILKRPDEYRLSVQADPTAPVLDIYAVAPTAAAATQLATASVEGLRDYLGSVAAKDRTPALDQVRIERLGSAQAGLVDGGASLQIATLTFLLVFTVACVGCLVAVRVRRGWGVAANGDTPPLYGGT